MRAPALALVLALPVPAIAGGYEGPDAYGQAMPEPRAGRVVVVRDEPARGGIFHELLRDRPRVEYVQRRRCPYPARPSDSVFSGGSGYIIKNDVRAAIGCAS